MEIGLREMEEFIKEKWGQKAATVISHLALLVLVVGLLAGGYVGVTTLEPGTKSVRAAITGQASGFQGRDVFNLAVTIVLVAGVVWVFSRKLERLTNSVSEVEKFLIGSGNPLRLSHSIEKLAERVTKLETHTDINGSRKALLDELWNQAKP